MQQTAVDISRCESTTKHTWIARPKYSQRLDLHSVSKVVSIYEKTTVFSNIPLRRNYAATFNDYKRMPKFSHCHDPQRSHYIPKQIYKPLSEPLSRISLVKEKLVSVNDFLSLNFRVANTTVFLH